MTAGSKFLRKIQLGGENTAGTAVAATTIWRGNGTIEDTRERVFVEEDVGYISGTDRAYFPFVEGQLEMDEIEATFEQLPHILEAGIKTATPTTDGSGYVYGYTFPTTAPNTILTYTIEGGDNIGAEEMAYCFVESFTISGTEKEALKMGAVWKGRQVAPTTFTSGLTLPTVEEILFTKGVLALDAVGGTFGGTPVSNTLVEFNFDCTTGWRAVYAANGQLYFSTIKCVGPEYMLEVTFEHNSDAVAEKAVWRAGTSRKLQLKFTGTALQTPGSTYTYKTLILNLVGQWEKFDKIDERDGNDIVVGTFKGGLYNSTAATAGEIIVVNENAAVIASASASPSASVSPSASASPS